MYLDEGQKPEVGRGLNKPAEVTMLRIHKLDKETGKPTTDPEAIDRCVWGREGRMRECRGEMRGVQAAWGEAEKGA